MNLGNILREGRQTEKAAECMIPFAQIVQNQPINKERSRLAVAYGLRMESWSEMRSSCSLAVFNDLKPFWDMKCFKMEFGGRCMDNL
jgi:hypothetical protein